MGFDKKYIYYNGLVEIIISVQIMFIIVLFSFADNTLKNIFFILFYKNLNNKSL